MMPADGASWARRLSVRHLGLLVGVAHAGSISDAARLAKTTQPALSKWLKELEDELGAPLFNRHARGLTPTRHGEVLLIHARRVLHEMGQAEHSIAALRTGGAHRVSVGTSPPQAPDVTPTAIAAFLYRHPGATVKLVEGTMRVLLEKLQQGELDLVIGGLDDYAPAGTLASEVLHRESIAVVARPGHPLTARTTLDWGDLGHYGWVVWPLGTPIRGKLDHALVCADTGPLPYRVESSSLTANFTLVQRTDMLCAVSSQLAAHFIEQGKVVRLPFELAGDSVVGMCWRNEPLPTVATSDMLQCLRQAATAGLKSQGPGPATYP